ncbi:cell envelope transcriptional attenuator family protein [Gottschalkia acidurici 9a]|uniref:Cell envelope transcriptional attenuator family protein n=1 Tax=Gottschalkia acidurici (strain ATCC 7906 / DSM 604 / BCRC 14475 / CIP 104303 / KCTC 5404 / NCIMB 10678 / 9a) TaxID=1128398 RepID=K0B1Q6_GOTA9|nr:LCP family protein [Gottschalkia acidurici]AFS79389.1 cell envelope transcriptional attenuator family protein [Gottschalkia acidurici 9a]
MSRFLRTFLFSLVCFSLFAIGGITAYFKIFDSEVTIPQDQVDKLDLSDKDPFERAILESKRVNGILLGVNEGMTDTIMFCSLDTENKKMDIISIPRDTFYHRKGYNGAADKKINAAYSSQGIDAVLGGVQNLLGDKVPIHHYGIIDYKGVEKIVDLVGGVEVDVPINMRYDDPYDKPPLRIRISKGRQVLDGKKAMEFLRFRQNNDKTGYPDMDLGRVKAQQQFMTAFLKKAIGLKLPNIIKTGFKYIETDVNISDGLSYGSKVIGIGSEDMNATTLPGEPRYIGSTSYFIHDPDETEKLIKQLYGVSEVDETQTEDDDI